MKHKLITLLLCLFLLLGTALVVSAQDAAVAEDIRKDTTISGTGYDRFSFLFDKDTYSYKKSNGNVSIKLENSAGMGSLYLMFNLEYGEYTITNNTTGATYTAGKYSFLHEYIDLEEAFGTCPTSITIDFANGAVRLSELYVFSSGAAPEYVQVWQPPLEGGADLLLLASHGDDDHLFFAGLLPYYAGELDYRVQVAYLTDHRNLTSMRTHEMLNGLWATGVEAYPVFGDFADFLIESLSGTYQEYERLGVSKSQLMEFVVTQLRRFKPQVVVGHDINGEYGHGMHMVYTDLLMQAVEIANDPAMYPASAGSYDVWDVPKTYLHLYEENPIVIDYDIPLESYDGLTAFQVSQKRGYPCHESQQYTWFTKWINGKYGEITKASQIATYNPCNFGLFRSTVGADVNKDDFMENIVSYAEQERLEAERLEQERLEAERKEQERLEAERKEQERLEAERKEQERLEAERLEAERKEQERLDAINKAKMERVKFFASFGIVGVLLIILIVLAIKLCTKKPAKQKR